MNSEDKLSLLYYAHFPGSTHGHGELEANESYGLANRQISGNSEQVEMGTFQPFKSPDLDNIAHALTQQGQDIILTRLRGVSYGYIPVPGVRLGWSSSPKLGRKTLPIPSFSGPSA